jgi:hypothetical protein
MCRASLAHTALGVAMACLAATPSHAVTFHVDCMGGSDLNSGCVGYRAPYACMSVWRWMVVGRKKDLACAAARCMVISIRSSVVTGGCGGGGRRTGDGGRRTGGGGGKKTSQCLLCLVAVVMVTSGWLW